MICHIDFPSDFPSDFHTDFHTDFPPTTGSRPLPFYLAAEELAARELDPANDYFFTWRVSPTVIIGRNQIYDTEVNADYCRANGIDIWRRKSGGGCVYADPDNIMLSFVTATGTDVASTFATYTERVAALLRSLGLDARAGSRNDVTIGGRKVSGNAFYRLPNGRSIAHGTMLIRVDPERMTAAITPSRIKLGANGVDSVRSRVTSLSEHIPDMTPGRFAALARSFICDTALTLSADQIAAIESLERPYHADSWTRGHSPRGRLAIDRRIDGVGTLRAELTVKGGVIEQIVLTGDFFATGDIDLHILDHLRGVEFTRDAIERALAPTDPSRAIMGLSRDHLTDLLASS